MKNKLAIFLCFLSAVSCSAMAEGADSLTKEDVIKMVNETIIEKEKSLETKNENEIVNKYFGAGIMANVDFGGKKSPRVKSARIIGGVVRVEEESKSQIGFMLEAHKFTKATGGKYVSGPFVGLVMSSEGAIDTGVLGYMWGFRQSQTSQTMNLGFGLSITPKAQVLGDGIIEGQPMPNGETEVRYKKTTKYGAAIAVSFGF